MLELDHSKIPRALVPLVPVAAKWGMGDDYERESSIQRASPEELNRLVHSIDGIRDDDLFGWLGREESFNSNPTEEYVAFTNLTMAIDSAKLELKKRNRV